MENCGVKVYFEKLSVNSSITVKWDKSRMSCGVVISVLNLTVWVVVLGMIDTRGPGLFRMRVLIILLPVEGAPVVEMLATCGVLYENV